MLDYTLKGLLSQVPKELQPYYTRLAETVREGRLFVMGKEGDNSTKSIENHEVMSDGLVWIKIWILLQNPAQSVQQ